MDKIKADNHDKKEPSEVSWQWRPRSWKIALIVFTVTAIIGGNAIRFLTEANNWQYNFVVIMMLAFAIWVAVTQREWPVWMRVLWVFGLLDSAFSNTVYPFRHDYRYINRKFLEYYVNINMNKIGKLP